MSGAMETDHANAMAAAHGHVTVHAQYSERAWIHVQSKVARSHDVTK
jgi:hypothetical protein